MTGRILGFLVCLLLVMPFLLVRMPFASAVEGKAKDFTGDGKIDMKDIGLVIKAVEPVHTLLAGDSIYDLNGDGVVDMTDVEIEAASFGFIFHLFNLSKWDSIFRMPKFEIAGLANKVASTSDGLEWNVTASGAVMRQWMINHDSRSFTIETANLDFYYQPPLDQELNVSEYDFVNATHAIKDDIVMVERPINVVGSYAVYSTTKRDNEYQTGKICHIYRPLLVDALGQTSWGWMNISDSTFTIGWNSSWVAACAFPLTIDPSFGYTNIGVSGASFTDYMDGVSAKAPTSGILDTISAALYQTIGVDCPVSFGIYANTSTSTWIANTSFATRALTTTSTWFTFACSSSSVVANTYYNIVAWGDAVGSNNPFISYDLGGATRNSTYKSLSYTTTWPSTVAFSYYTNLYSVYCNYTEAPVNTPPTIGGFTVSSGATVYGYQNVNVSITLQDVEGAYNATYGLKNCTISFDQAGIDLRWNATGNATDKVDASNYCNLVSNWTTSNNATSVNVTWSVTFYWNATETVYGLDSNTKVWDMNETSASTTTGSFTFEDDLIVKATPSFNETRSDPSSIVFLSGQLYYQGTTTAPYNTTGITANCELNSTSKGTNSSIGSDGTFQISVTLEASPIGTYYYNIYSMTDQASTTNQTASFILEQIEIYAKDDPIIQPAISSKPISVTVSSSSEPLLIIPILFGLALVLGFRRKLKKPLTIATILVLINSCIFVLLSITPTVSASYTSSPYYLRSEYGTHDQPDGRPSFPTDTGTLNITGATSDEERHCAAWVQFWFDMEDTIQYWWITSIYYHVYWNVSNNGAATIGYQCNGTYSQYTQANMSIGTGDDAWHLLDSSQNVNISIPNIASQYLFAIKLYQTGGHSQVDAVRVLSNSTWQSYITFTYNGTVEPSNIDTTNTNVLANCTFYTYWTAEAGLSKYMFGCNNTGAWANETSWTDPWTGTPSTGWSNITKILNYTVGVTVTWQFWVNDTANNFNTTGEQTFDITGKDVSVPVDTYVVVWFMARYESDSANYTDGNGTLLVNGTSATYDGANNYWWVNVTQSVAGTYTYNVSAVADSTYGLTALNDVVGGVTVEWYTLAFSAEITVNTTTHSWSLNPGDNNVTITESTISITVTANRNFNVQAKSLNATLAYGANSIALGNLLMSQTSLALAVNMTTEYQTIPGLADQDSGVDLAKTFVLWLNCPVGTPAGPYVYTLSIQVTDAT